MGRPHVVNARVPILGPIFRVALDFDSVLLTRDPGDAPAVRNAFPPSFLRFDVHGGLSHTRCLVPNFVLGRQAYLQFATNVLAVGNAETIPKLL